MFKSFTRSNPAAASNVIDIGGKTGEAVAPLWQPTEADNELIERLELKSQLHEIILDRFLQPFAMTIILNWRLARSQGRVSSGTFGSTT